DLPRAEAEVARLLEIEPSGRLGSRRESALLLAFRVARARGDVAAARAAADRAISAGPGSVPALLARAEVALAEADPARVRVLAGSAAAADPDAAGPRLALSRALEAGGDLASALAALDGPRATGDDALRIA